MPAHIRKLAFLGAVLLSIVAVPAYAQDQQTSPTTDLPTATNTAPLPPAPTSAPATIPTDLSAPATANVLTPPPNAVPTMGTTPAPSAPAATTPTATHHKNTHTQHAHKATTHKRSAKKVVHASSKKHGAKGAAKVDEHVKDAQTRLANLEYYKAPIDGISGSKTRTAIKAFQHDHKIKADGKLNQATYDELVQADKEREVSSLPAGTKKTPLPPMPRVVAPEAQPPEAAPLAQGPDFYATHPDFYGHYNQNYDNPVLLGPTQTLYSRFAKIELNEDQTPAPTKKYNISLNGLPLILVDGQPSVIGVSKTFQIGDEDILIFTSYRDNDPSCAYDYNLLVLAADGTKSHEIQNCTRGYQAKEDNGMLFITFPESTDERANQVGQTWRYDHGDLERL